MTCNVRQENDELVCKCGLRWDVSDPEPPRCYTDSRKGSASREAEYLATQPNRRFVERMAARIPLELPADVAGRMAAAFMNADDHIEGMRAAYRLFMDSLP